MRILGSTLGLTAFAATAFGGVLAAQAEDIVIAHAPHLEEPEAFNAILKSLRL